MRPKVCSGSFFAWRKFFQGSMNFNKDFCQYGPQIHKPILLIAQKVMNAHQKGTPRNQTQLGFYLDPGLPYESACFIASSPGRITSF